MVAGAVYLHGMNTSEVSEHRMTEINQIDDPKLDRIIDSLEIPNAAFNLALNGFHDLKSKGLGNKSATPVDLLKELSYKIYAK